MDRRQLLRYGKMGLLAALGGSITSQWLPAQAQTSSQVDPGLVVRWLGHTCFLFAGEGQKFLVNPFRPIGCTAGYKPPREMVDLVLVSSRLLDEGSYEELPGNPRVLQESGAYEFRGKAIQGIRTIHDREGGRRFGINIAWTWAQAGIKIVHLGGAAAPITAEQQILMGRPDLLLIPVGGGPKAYNAEEAKQVIQTLNPKLIIPTHYRTQAAAPNACDIEPVDEFLTVMSGAANIEKVNSDSISLTPADLPQTGRLIKTLSYKF
ncbi:MAG TPA: MBL fold metallo-hydrolase [Oscillatoriaceae cyanobacterium M33_DOE_052]|uniref:Zn-dependent hydrolase n=1 Tax=Planktothricoides sp. SpSt-374 TaxID=2282167 RepID=A0A7C3ZY55_9CYAN|nr:MBL fold metallo-hydrolase [Oscillatoriaceae cyanobacterium M33_DOE_052]